MSVQVILARMALLVKTASIPTRANANLDLLVCGDLHIKKPNDCLTEMKPRFKHSST